MVIIDSLIGTDLEVNDCRSKLIILVMLQLVHTRINDFSTCSLKNSLVSKVFFVSLV